MKIRFHISRSKKLYHDAMEMILVKIWVVMKKWTALLPYSY